MTDDRVEKTREGRGGERISAGENLRRAYPVSRDGTFASFLLLLEGMEAVPVGQKTNKQGFAGDT